jgi:ethanolamine utilization protein EutN
MRIGEVVGVVTLNRAHPSLSGATFRLAVPLALEELVNDWRPHGEELVVYDELGAGIGSRIAFSEGAEAAQPFLPQVKPIDAYCAAILDDIQLARTEDGRTNKTEEGKE